MAVDTALARRLLDNSPMRTIAAGEDMITLARLHAALDSVVETEQQIAAIRDASAIPHVGRVAELLDQARELLRGMLRKETRHAVGLAGSGRDSK
jgi:hypothetical protein